MICDGVSAGYKIPYQESTSNAGKPPSEIVGSSGNKLLRFKLVTPSARSLPLRTCGIVIASAEKFTATCPPIASVSANVDPLYGMWVNSIFARLLNNSAARCVADPLPEDE